MIVIEPKKKNIYMIIGKFVFFVYYQYTKLFMYMPKHEKCWRKKSTNIVHFFIKIIIFDTGTEINQTKIKWKKEK